MSSFTLDTDTLVHVFGTNESTTIGHQSEYIDVPHPGTNKEIEGWHWDNRYWPTSREFQAAGLAPSLWDPTTSGINETSFQSGYGDNKDLLLLDIEDVMLSGLNVWAPKVNHGYFYIYDDEWYLFSDDYLTEYFTATGLIDSKQYLQLSHDYKPTIPIQVHRWRYDYTTGRYIDDLSFRKVLEFSDTASPEFIVDLDYSPPRILLDDDYTEVVGNSVTLSPLGIADAMEISGLELLGISAGIADQEFLAEFSPFDPNATVEVWSWNDSTLPMLWSGILPVQEFTPGASLEVKIDRDLGSIQFGNYNSATGLGAGKIVSKSHRVGIYYTKGLAVQYEPEKTRDYILAYQESSDINPINTAIGSGFVHIIGESIEPFSITLTSTLPQINPFLIEMGNNIGELIATVRSAAGELLEGQRVTFEILEPQIGTFGPVATSIAAVTDENGEARTFYNPPLTVQDIGRASTSVTHNVDQTQIEVDNLVNTGTTSGLFLFKVHQTDEVLGISSVSEDSYYEDYLDEIGTQTGDQDTVAFEKEFRTTRDLLKPTLYTPGDLTTGKKTIVLTQKLGVMNPHTGDYDSSAFSPLYADLVETLSPTSVRLTYSGLLDLPGTNDTKAYFVIGPIQTNLQAFTTNRRTNEVIKSNVIDMRVTIPDSANGTYFCDVLNDLPAGLLTNTIDVDILTDEQIVTLASGELYETYLLERSGYYQTTESAWDTDANTIALWHLDGDFLDSSGNGWNLDPTSGLNFTTDGFGQSAETNTTGAYTQVTGLFFERDLSQGTIELNFKSTDPLNLADELGYLFLASWEGGGSPSQLYIAFHDSIGGIKSIETAMQISGIDPGYSRIPLTSVPEILDGEYHHFKVTWDTATSPGYVTYGLYIDNVLQEEITGAVPGPPPSLYTGGLLVPLGLSSYAPQGLYDEIRYSDIVRTDGHALDFSFYGEGFTDWFRRIERLDSNFLGLNNVTPIACPSEIPLGFRLKSDGITIASILDQVTFLDPNDHLPSGYYTV